MPNVLPLPMMFVQRFLMLASSAGLNVARMKGVSVRLNAPAAAPACSVVPKASTPPASGKGAVPAKAAELVQLVPVKLAAAPVFTSFTTIELGRTPVSVLLIMSWFTESDTKPLGVMRQEQQLTSCSSGENA